MPVTASANPRRENSFEFISFILFLRKKEFLQGKAKTTSAVGQFLLINLRRGLNLFKIRFIFSLEISAPATDLQIAGG
jgi:hypothetical protein